jgi:hypothetical protein
MKKLKLDLGALKVDTFDATAPVELHGTVRGLDDSEGASFDYWCPSLWPTDCCTADATCPASCNATCGASCGGTCGWSCPDHPTCGHTEPNVCPY